VGKSIVVVNNLQPTLLRGEASNGMLLAATSGEKVILLTVDDPDCAVGAKIK
jgi:methionyl-tRNA synthetase